MLNASLNHALIGVINVTYLFLNFLHNAFMIIMNIIFHQLIITYRKISLSILKLIVISYYTLKEKQWQYFIYISQFFTYKKVAKKFRLII